jgi:hypothetical protein
MLLESRRRRSRCELSAGALSYGMALVSCLVPSLYGPLEAGDGGAGCYNAINSSLTSTSRKMALKAKLF